MLTHMLMWRSEDILWELGLFFYHVGPWNWTLVFRLSGRCLHLLSHLVSPQKCKIYINIY